jgi:hypothetical protein
MANEILTIDIEVKDDLDAYRVLNRTNFEHNVLGSKYKGQSYKFDKDNLPKHFLKKKGEYLTDDQLKNGSIE